MESTEREFKIDNLETIDEPVIQSPSVRTMVRIRTPNCRSSCDRGDYVDATPKVEHAELG